VWQRRLKMLTRTKKSFMDFFGFRQKALKQWKKVFFYDNRIRVAPRVTRCVCEKVAQNVAQPFFVKSKKHVFYGR
jgi:hypothetical protein